MIFLISNLNKFQKVLTSIISNNRKGTKETTSKKADKNVIDLSELKPNQGFAIKGIQDADSGIYGSVSGAGDVNGDGYQNIIIGVPDTAVNNQLTPMNYCGFLPVY